MFASDRKSLASKSSHSPAGAPPPKAAEPAEVEAEASPREIQGPQLTLARIAITAPPLQRKPAVSSPDDPLEHEADDVAEQVMRMKEPVPIGLAPKAIHRAICSECEDEEETPIQAQREPSRSAEAELDVESAVSAAGRGGEPLPQALRSHFEPRFGHDFSQVRVHSDTEAASAARGVQARAYTIGGDIVFGAGQYQPDSDSGRRLLAHELTHVVQQGAAGKLGQQPPEAAPGDEVQRAAAPSSTAAVRERSATPFIGRENTKETAAVLGTGKVAGSGVQFWPLEVTSTRIGPVSGQGGLINDRRNRLSVIVGPSMTPKSMATLLLPLWNSATPFTPPDATAPLVTPPITADELARGLLAYNRYYLRILSEPKPSMTGWAVGLRFPLPVEIDSTGAATVNKDQIQALATGFDAAWEPLLAQAAAAVTAPAAADLHQSVADFLTATPDTDARGMSLATRTLTNPIEARPFVLEAFNQLADKKFELALAFMDALVNPQVSLLASQRDGAAVLAAIRAAISTPPADLPAKQQESLTRTNNMLGLVTSIVAREPPTLGAKKSGLGGTEYPSSALKDFGNAEQTAFKRQVYEAHVASAKARGRKFSLGLADNELAAVEGGKLRKDAAPFLTDLLKRAREDLETAKTAKEALAMGAASIGVVSTYRGAPEELNLWEKYFPDYYANTAADRAAAAGGEHGPAAVQVMVAYYTSAKAAPGFGNHTNGVAVDFSTSQGGTSLGAKKSQNGLWKKSWFHGWLVAHASEFHFTPLASEAWHWEYSP